ncbi:hypothetical protein SAMN04489712_101765 [Thermomonospora echinospora]|uniref:Uncharacterized protein n=1 Tax=Thermomonospora echinospora TaxID=1992 RepID=A0A1H5TVP1_9ACTN|nr:hypothetical protein [Thermomonospora echinospora]SEF66905.1 hypothetical protein SAMN04489712_101765 [Thermomonospora echinospora]
MTAYVKPRFRLPGQDQPDRPLPPVPRPDPVAVAIQQVRATIWTADADYADTRSRLYLGLAGREFALSIDENDLARAARTTFVLGEEANIDNAAGNDPRTPPFPWRDGEHPVYLRLETDGDEPAWLLEWARIDINPDTDQAIAYEQPALPGPRPGHRLWLSDTTGKIVYLTRATTRPAPPADTDPEPESQP